MLLKLSLVFTIFWLYHCVTSKKIPFSDFFLPLSIDGYLCGENLYNILSIRDAATKAHRSFLFESPPSKFPAYFEDWSTFSVVDEIFLTWPLILSDRSSSTIGRDRVVINSKGQIMGAITVDFDETVNSASNYKKCTPISFNPSPEENLSADLDLFWSKEYPTMGYGCGPYLLPNLEIDRLRIFISNRHLTRQVQYMRGTDQPREYTGNLFNGDKLLAYNPYKKNELGSASGQSMPCRIIFNLSEGIKGVIYGANLDTKCQKVFDISKLVYDPPQIPVTITDYEKMEEKNREYSCANEMLRLGLVLNFINFAKAQISRGLVDDGSQYPILQDSNLLLWPIRLPEKLNDNLPIIFAVGYSLNDKKFEVYYSLLLLDKYIKYTKC
ncbi:BgtE-20028 [Blumeria graminis f. sp. tritici]|uniref:BgtE-20028 n=1 Tax=Blumeria graminis f. sp. tritici TaxID=62690 RepID=A0A9X9QC55_BLUGR|nr:BgtE-20028 [Blumeria graminis f. sp. tritici]